MPRINKAIELLAQGIPVFYTNTAELTFENGVRLAQTWAEAGPMVRTFSVARMSKVKRGPTIGM